MSARLDLDAVEPRRLDLGAARSDGGSRRSSAGDAEDLVSATGCRDDWTRRMKDAEFTEVRRRNAADDVKS